VQCFSREAGGDEMSRTGIVIALVLLAALALAGACNGGDEGGPGGIELPEGFPRDFPIYEEAITRVETFTPEEGGFLVSIDTEHSRDQVQAFYERVLNEDPWQVDNVDVVDVSDGEDEIVVIEFSRVGNGGEWGTVAIGIIQENGQYATIGISLNLPQ
jgi:hypothetical protein